MGEPTAAVIAAALAMIRAAGRGDLLAEEPAGPSAMNVRPARRASAGVAAAIVSCTSSPSRSESQSKRGRRGEKAKEGGKGRGGEKGKGPAKRQWENTAEENANRRESRPPTAGPTEDVGLEEGEIDSASEEEIEPASGKKSRSREGGQDYVSDEGEASESSAEGAGPMEQERPPTFREQTGWHGRGRGEALERRADSHGNIVTLQNDGAAGRGNKNANGRAATPARGASPASPCFRLAEEQGVTADSVTGLIERSPEDENGLCVSGACLLCFVL